MEEDRDNLEYLVNNAVQTDAVCLSLASLDLEEISGNVFTPLVSSTTIKTLNLEYNDLRSLPDEIGLLTSLEELSLTGNQLECLPKSIGQLDKLRLLYLNENCLTELPYTLSKLHNLQVLDIVGNSLQTWPDEFGLGLTSLSELRADENCLHSLPDSFTCLSNLTVLELAENKLTKLPAKFGNLQELRILNLNKNKIEELPASFSELENLVSIDITDNHMEFLMENFKSAEKLQYFYAANNMFKVLPSWFEKLNNILELNLSNNELNGMPLPEKFGHVSGNTLISLDLSGNKITALPDSIGQLQKLETFHLGSTICELERKAFQNGNWLPRLPDSFGQMMSLTKLHLDENQLCSLPERFGDLRSLEWLDVSQNLIRELPKSFCSLTNLWYLQFSKNNLESLPEDFGNLSNLVELRLDSNSITALPGSFASLQNVQTVDLFRNRLTEIPKVLLKLKNLRRLDLDGNKLKIKEYKVPKLTTPVQYAPRDPTLKGNWRGKIREDKQDHFKNAVETEQSISDLLDNAELEEEPDDEAEQEVNYSERVFEMAMRRGLSIWKSHTGPDTRDDESKVSSQDEFFRFVPQENPCQEIYEDASDQTISVSNSSTGEDQQLVSEDWDQEVYETWPQTHPKKGIQVMGDDIPLRDQLQDILHSYPPAKQAFTQSAMYESIYRRYIVPDYCNNKTLVDDTDENGQFEDAD